MPRFLAFCFVMAMVTAFSSATYGQEPTWRSEVVTSRQLREQIESTPIENRPYRPFHFYGNAVRRMHYRGYPLPLPRDFAQGFQAVFGRSSR